MSKKNAKVIGLRLHVIDGDKEITAYFVLSGPGRAELHRQFIEEFDPDERKTREQQQLLLLSLIERDAALRHPDIDAKLHREDGPAYIERKLNLKNGSVSSCREEWWQNGKRHAAPGKPAGPKI